MIRIIVLVVFLCIVGLLGSAWLAVDSQPTVVSSDAQKLDQADEVDDLFKQIQSSVLNRDAPTTIEITENQLASLQGMMQRATVHIDGDVSITEQRGLIRGSMNFDFDNKTHYVNVEVTVGEGEGFPIESVKVGGVNLPGSVAKMMAANAVNLYTNSNVGSETLSAVENIDLQNGKVVVGLRPLAPLLTELRRIDTGDNSPEDRYLEQQTAMYLRVIADFESEQGVRHLSLSEYIQRVFEVAAQRSTQDTVVDNNRAAILALAVFAGHYRIGTFVGDVQQDVDKPVSPNHWPVLAKRADLTKHFIISAALKLLSQRGFSLAVGEFKELMDRADGGSGYSFVDLAADRAGVRFAVEAVNPQRALAFQQQLAQGANEALFFPSIDGLREGYSKRAFNEKFGSVDSQAYKREVNKIRGRISKMPLYSS